MQIYPSRSSSISASLLKTQTNVPSCVCSSEVTQIPCKLTSIYSESQRLNSIFSLFSASNALKSAQLAKSAIIEKEAALGLM